MFVLLILVGSDPVEKKDLISLHIAGPTVGQLVWKKLAEKPSGPRTLSGWIANMASFISWFEGSEVRCLFVSAEIQGVRALVTISVACGFDEVKMAWK